MMADIYPTSIKADEASGTHPLIQIRIAGCNNRPDIIKPIPSQPEKMGLCDEMPR
jgi:hypothetical protein